MFGAYNKPISTRNHTETDRVIMIDVNPIISPMKMATAEAAKYILLERLKTAIGEII